MHCFFISMLNSSLFFSKLQSFLLTFAFFDSITALFFGGIAQMVERWNHNPCVGGSIPSSATN